MIPAIDASFFQREIADAAYRHQESVDSGERLIVGVNAYVDPNEREPELLRVDPSVERIQVERLQAVRARRDGAEVERTLAELRPRRRGRRQHHAGAARLRPRLRQRGRDVRHAARRLRAIPGDAGLLGRSIPHGSCVAGAPQARPAGVTAPALGAPGAAP